MFHPWFVSYVTSVTFRFLLREMSAIPPSARKKEEAHIFECDMLVIDDLGSEFYTQFTASSLFNVINERQLAGRSTVISTNLSFDDIIFNYSERTYSRICKHYDLYKILGTDLRRHT